MEEVIDLLVSAGLVHVSLGIESMSVDQLIRYLKRETPENHISAVASLAEKGVQVQGYCILADPLIKRKELLDNLEGLYELSSHILLVIHEKMTLYTTTGYYKENKDKILVKKQPDNILDVAIEYDFNDPWCQHFFCLFEEASIWSYKKIVKALDKRKGIFTNQQRYDFIQTSTKHRIALLIEIVQLDNPDIPAIKLLKEQFQNNFYKE